MKKRVIRIDKARRARYPLTNISARLSVLSTHKTSGAHLEYKPQLLS
jgi:hypothetical protein